MLNDRGTSKNHNNPSTEEENAIYQIWKWLPKSAYARWSLIIQGCLLLTTISYTCASCDQRKTMQRELELSTAGTVVPALQKPRGLEPGVTDTITLVLKNIGKLNARDVTPRFSHEFAKQGEFPAFRMPRIERRPLTIFPSQSIVSSYDIPGEELTKQVIDEVHTNKRLLYIFGAVRYYDGFGDQCVSFCWTLIPPVDNIQWGGCDVPFDICRDETNMPALTPHG
ncbi:MAG: hypothetical protein ACHQ9S_08435 [Candidatus Binatia bacterium]